MKTRLHPWTVIYDDPVPAETLKNAQPATVVAVQKMVDETFLDFLIRMNNERLPVALILTDEYGNETRVPVEDYDPEDTAYICRHPGHRRIFKVPCGRVDEGTAKEVYNDS